MQRPFHSRGFTLIELMVTVAIVGILASIALPSYSAYIKRSRVPPALDGLTAFAARMEQRYQDSGCYANTCTPTVGSACGPTVPTPVNFTVTCVLNGSTGQAFTATATGSGPVAGYTYTINDAGVRATTAHPMGTNATCWTMKGTSCDSQ